jgi:hypothetical protein
MPTKKAFEEKGSSLPNAAPELLEVFDKPQHEHECKTLK